MKLNKSLMLILAAVLLLAGLVLSKPSADVRVGAQVVSNNTNTNTNIPQRVYSSILQRGELRLRLGELQNRLQQTLSDFPVDLSPDDLPSFAQARDHIREMIVWINQADISFNALMSELRKGANVNINAVNGFLRALEQDISFAQIEGDSAEVALGDLQDDLMRSVSFQPESAIITGVIFTSDNRWIVEAILCNRDGRRCGTVRWDFGELRPTNDRVQQLEAGLIISDPFGLLSEGNLNTQERISFERRTIAPFPSSPPSSQSPTDYSGEYPESP